MPSKLSVLPTLAAVLFVAVVTLAAGGAVLQGSPEKARAYYASTAAALSFRDAKSILDSTLDDVPRYLGYGLTGRDLERIAPAVLMDPVRLGTPCDVGQICETEVADVAAFARAFAVRPLRPDDILAARFLAPKIANVADPPTSRVLGWRKLVRLRARDGSDASRRGISAAIVLFNFFTQPSEAPFGPQAESVNTQVMLLTAPAAFARGDRDSLYWLDYGKLSEGGRLSLQLDATFDASDLQGAGAVKPYYVPDGCVACHGESPARPTVNYLDTDHWFDRDRKSVV